MDRNILITGGNSDIGISLIKKIKDAHDVKIISTRNNGLSIKKYVDQELTVDFSEGNIDGFSSQLDGVVITDLICLHGTSSRNDCLTNGVNKELVDINLMSVINLVESLLPHMVENKFGRIIVVGTASSKHGGGKSSFSYGLAKSGLVYLAQHLAKYYSMHNIITNCVSPGFVETKFHNKIKNKNEVLERVKAIPLGRSAGANEIADVIYFLLFSNSYINGQNLIADGGDFI